MDAPFKVAQISPPRNARLLFVSSQARPPSSQESFQKACMNLTASMEPLLSIAVFAFLSVSAPPKFHKSGYAQAGASPKVWPRVCPYGCPFFLSFAETCRRSSYVLGKVVAPISSNHDFRYAMSPGTMLWGRAMNLPPTLTYDSDCA